jgi:hypothetical protein
MRHTAIRHTAMRCTPTLTPTSARVFALAPTLMPTLGQGLNLLAFPLISAGVKLSKDAFPTCPITVASMVLHLPSPGSSSAMSSVDKVETAGGYFRVLPCTACSACYIRGNYERHPLEAHGVKGRRKRAVVEGLAGVEASVAEVMRLPYGQVRIDGLRVRDG